MTTDTIDATLKMPKQCLPVAPACVTIGALSRAPHISSLASVPFSESGGQGRFRKEIVWDREEGDFAMYLDTGHGFELVGFARNYSEADTTLDELIFAIRHQDTPGTDCPSCGDLLCEDAAVCAACRESEECSTPLSPPVSYAPAPAGYFLSCTICGGPHRPTQCPEVAAEKARQAREESAGRGIARQARHDRARFLRCVARVGDSDRLAMAGALAGYLSGRTDLFTSAPISVERILAFWASEQALSDY